MSLTASDGVPFVMNVEPSGGSCNSGNNGNGWGDGNGVWWLLVLFIFAFGWGGFGGFGGNGFGNNGGGINSPAGQGALTRADLCQSESFQDVKRGVQNVNDAVNGGFSALNSTICNQQYDTARMVNGLENTVQSGFNATNVAMLQGQNALSAQLANCCCETREGIAGVNYSIAQQTNALGTQIQGLNYNLATQGCDTRNTIQSTTRDIIDNQNANARAVLDKLTQQEIEAKNTQITALNQQLFAAQLAASQTAQNQYLVNQLRPCPIPAYISCNPWANTAAYGSCGSCGA